MYEQDECKKDCKCYTCMKSTSCGRDCNHPFHCKVMTVKCTSQRELCQLECTVIAGMSTGERGIVLKEGTLNTVRLVRDGSIVGLRADEIILD